MEPHQVRLLIIYISGIVIAIILYKAIPRLREFLHGGDEYDGERATTAMIFVFFWPIVSIIGSMYLFFQGFKKFIVVEKPEPESSESNNLKRKLDGVK